MKALDVVNKALNIENGKSNKKRYQGKSIDIYTYIFNSDGSYTDASKYYSYKNGVKISSSPLSYSKGDNASKYISNLPKGFDPKLNFPSVIVIIDTGSFSFTMKSLENIANLKKAGIYEYVS